MAVCGFRAMGIMGGFVGRRKWMSEPKKVVRLALFSLTSYNGVLDAWLLALRLA